MAKYLTKADIDNAPDAVFEDVPVPEWGGIVRVKSLSAAEKDAFEFSLTTIQQQGKRTVTKPNLVNVRAKLAARCMVDENGQRLYDDIDVASLGRKSGAALDRVVDVAKRLNRMDDGDLAVMADGLKNAPPAASPID